MFFFRGYGSEHLVSSASKNHTLIGQSTYYIYIMYDYQYKVSSHDLLFFLHKAMPVSHLCSHISHLTNSIYLDFSNSFYI